MHTFFGTLCINFLIKILDHENIFKHYNNYWDDIPLVVFPLYWNMISIKHHGSLTCTMWLFDLCTYCEVMTTIRLVGASNTVHRCFFFGGGELRSTLSSTFKHTISLTMVTTLDTKAPELIHFIIGSSYLLTIITHLPIPPKPWKLTIYSVSMNFPLLTF